MNKDVKNKVYKYLLTIIAFGLHIMFIDSSDWFDKAGISAIFVFLFSIISYYDKYKTYEGSYIYGYKIISRLLYIFFMFDAFIFLMEKINHPIENISNIRLNLISSSLFWLLFMGVFYRLFVGRDINSKKFTDYLICKKTCSIILSLIFVVVLIGLYTLNIFNYAIHTLVSYLVLLINKYIHN